MRIGMACRARGLVEKEELCGMLGIGQRKQPQKRMLCLCKAQYYMPCCVVYVTLPAGPFFAVNNSSPATYFEKESWRRR